MAKYFGGLEMFHFVYIILLGAVMIVLASENPCNPRQHTFHAAENRALRRFAYTTKTVRSRVVCGRECSMDETCKSFNFNECNQLCELNNLTRKEQFIDFIESQGSTYFDADEDTPLLSLADISLDRYRSCKMLLDAGHRASGVYIIYPGGIHDGCVQVYCDMDTDGGGWIVFQRRQDGSVDFYRNWAEYQSGFGDLPGEFWLGNDNLVSLTSDDSHGTWGLRVDLEDWDNNTAWAKYEDFKISQGEYTLHIGQYDASSTAGGDSLDYIRGRHFTTKDNDNDGKSDGNCAEHLQGAWWFGNCGGSHLNSIYKDRGATYGITWYGWRGSVSLKTCSMKMRETGRPMLNDLF